MTVDEQGRSKGFAFVEFEQEASLFLSPRCRFVRLRLCMTSIAPEQKDALNALNANNYDLKSRRMAVTMSDSRVRSRRKYVAFFIRGF